ncbi:hypothetical protein MKX03_035740 [Papaver bracteatum]|nr:hypothetical protein MKX03_035740 [Papaver bracteatum]
MKDPLPSSKITMDRPIIQRYLLSDNVFDPFDRSHLTQDMLIPDVELKARIIEFIRSHGLKKHSCEGLNKEATQPK